MKVLLVHWLTFLGVSCCFDEQIQTEQPAQINEPFSYMCTIPITKLTTTQIPCVDIFIEGKLFSVSLDLGFKGTISISETSIDQILSKKLIDTTPMTNITGKIYQANLYSLPEMKIGNLTYHQLTLKEDSAASINDVYCSSERDAEHPIEDQGKLGWELFFKGTLLIDIKKLNVVFSDTLDTMKKQGFFVEDFVKVPFSTERGLVEFEARTLDGSLLCVLDTGCTWNVMNTDVDEGRSLSQTILDPDSITERSLFNVDECNFGPISFRSVPIKTPFRIDAILGVKFFENHIVVLDFVNKFVYFSKISDPVDQLLQSAAE